MTSPLEKACERIRTQKAAGKSHINIARRLFSYDHPVVLEENASLAFDIFNAVAIQFHVPISHVRSVGSGHLGYSFLKSKDFEPKTSDFDLAIVDTNLFRSYCEHAYQVTKGYTDNTQFAFKKGESTYTPFIQSIARGFFRPDLMPRCHEKTCWDGFFDSLSRKYQSLFRDINCGIYLSETIFDQKQSLVIENTYRENNDQVQRKISLSR